MNRMKLSDSLKKALFPARCIVCNKVTSDGGDICAGCEGSAAAISGECCEFCGCKKQDCICRKKSRYFEKIFAPFYYEDGTKKTIHSFKFNGRQWLYAPMSRYMAEKAEERFDFSTVDVVLCVPFTKKQLRKRGYNQSRLLGEGVSKRLGLPFDGEALVKLYDTEAQHKTAKVSRAGNVMGIFDVQDPEKIRGRTVLLCDDIKTTGATLDECSKMLILNGAEKVYGLCFAITRGKEPGKDGQGSWQD